MKFILIKLFTLLICVAIVKSDCNVCQGTNRVACHSENTYSLCVNGHATDDFIKCPENYVCTSDRYICYPLPDATPSCSSEKKTNVNLCGVCSENKLFACLNETTVGFCLGKEDPVDGVVSYCPENTVCDISNPEYCSEASMVKPSCVSDSPGKELIGLTTISTATSIETTTTKPKTITTEPTTNEPSSTITTESTTITTEATTITTEPTTIITESTKISAEPTTTITTETSTISPTKATTETSVITTEAATSTKPTTTTSTEPSVTNEDMTIATKAMNTTTEPITTTTEATITTTEPTKTTTTEPTTTTPAPPRDADTICKDAGSTGCYKSEVDKTCTKFIVCYINGTRLAGLTKNCTKGQYFDPEKRSCSVNKPEGCP